MNTDIGPALTRGLEVGHLDNPWVSAAGMTLSQFLALSGDDIRERIRSISDAGAGADATRHPEVAAFLMSHPLREQARARTTIADELQAIFAMPASAVRGALAARPGDAIAAADRNLTEIAPHIAKASEGALDPELLLTVRGTPPSIGQIAGALGTLEAYLRSTKSFLGFLALGKKRVAERILTPLGLRLGVPDAERAREFLARLRALLVVRSTVDTITGTARSDALPDRDSTLADAAATARIVRTLARAHGDPLLKPVAPRIISVIAGQEPESPVLAGLRAAPARAAALEALEQAVADSKLIDAGWASPHIVKWRQGEEAAVQPLASTLPTLESVLRLRDSLERLHDDLRPHIQALLEGGVDADQGLAALALACTSGRIATLIEGAPKLHATDARRVQTMFTRWRELEQHRQQLVRDMVRARWLGRQRQRLAVGTGSRLNSDGAKVRQRLITRGARA